MAVWVNLALGTSMLPCSPLPTCVTYPGIHQAKTVPPTVEYGSDGSSIFSHIVVTTCYCSNTISNIPFTHEGKGQRDKDFIRFVSRNEFILLALPQVASDCSSQLTRSRRACRNLSSAVSLFPEEIPEAQ